MSTSILVSLLLVAAAGAGEEWGPDRARVALLAIADTRRFDSWELTPLVRSPDRATRAETARVLGRLDRLEALDFLEVLCRDSDAGVRAQAVEAVGRLAFRWPGGLPGAFAQRAGARLAAALADPSPEVRVAACWAAPAVPFPRRSELLAARASADPSVEVRARALAELWRLPDKRWIKVAAKAAKHPDASLRLAAVWALTRGGDATADRVLAASAADRDPAVRVAALDAARRGHAAALWEPALAATAAADDTVRTAAWLALAAAFEKGGGEALPPAVVERLCGVVQSRDPERAHERVAAIRLAGAARACLSGLEFVAAGGERWLAGEAAAALGRWPDRAEATLRLARTDGDPRQLAVIRSLGRVAGSAATLVQLLRHEQAQVRLAAVEAAAQHSSPEVGEALTALLDDPDPVVRAATIETLAEAGRLPPAEDLAMRLEREREGKAVDPALALVAAITKHKELGPGARATLRRALAVPDPTVARAAWAAFVAHGEPLPVPAATGEEADVYSRVASWASAPRYLELVTERGSLQVELNVGEAPLACYRLWQLAEQGFYNNLTFHRVVPTFVAQGGDPRGDGWGGPGFSLRHEDSLTPYLPGVVGLAHAGPDTSGSQLFVTLTRQPHLDGRYPVVGRLVRGLEVARRLRVGDRILRARTTTELGSYYPIWYGTLEPAQLADGLEGWREERLKYEPEPRWLEMLAGARLRYELVVALGTWCGDSREQIPRLQALVTRLGPRSPFSSLKLVGVDRSKWVDSELYPFGPLERVPTIVVTAGGAEIGRIVETPRSGRMEEDLVRILAPIEGWAVEDSHE